ncbi:cysteine synthase [Candidatus Marinamargulisbacteria bacterium SCGC AG-343-D04]|nr:cysteine synthase [Candidatus Marinamargulisbacteria bacterium SCGC AG-343-D04]
MAVISQETVSIYDLVGNTPLLEIVHNRSESVKILAKCEWYNPSGSVKDRAAHCIFQDALKSGELSNKILIDATSGNTGLAFAMLGAFYQVPIELALPENASLERKLLIKNYGAKIHFTSSMEGTDGAQRFVQDLVKQYPEKYFYPDQYNNELNWKAHFQTTGPEIWSQTKGAVSHFVAGLGTSGTFVGTSKFLKEKGVHCVSVQPDNPLHGLEGWKHMETAIVPGIYDASVADDNRVVSTDRAFSYARSAFCHLGLALSPSSAANLVVAKDMADSLESGVVVTVFPDNASKYLQDSFWKDDDYIIENPFF